MIATSRVEAETATTGPAQRRAWLRALLLFAAATALLFGLMHQTVVTLVRTWMTSDTFGYGFLILPIVVFLLYQRRRDLAAVAPQPSFWALAWLAGALLVNLIGTVGSVTLLKQLAFIGIWQGLFALLFGWEVVKRALFPLFFLVFAVPMGEEAVPFLQTITAEIAVFLLRASGVPTFHSGVLIEIPSGNFVVADVCSGARFLITTLVLGALASNLFFLSWRRRALFMLACLVVPILANGLRAYGIVLLAHLTDHDLAVTVDHILYGFIFLSFVLLILTGIGSLFRERWGQDEAPRPAPAQPAARAASSLAAFVLGAVLLAGGQAWALRVTAPPEVAGATDPQALRPGDGWQLAVVESPEWKPAFPGADRQVLETYGRTDGPVTLFAAYYLYQRDGHEIIAVGNSFIGHGQERQVTRFEDVAVSRDAGELIVRETVVQFAEGPYLIWSWYEVGGSTTASSVKAKLLELWHALSGGPREATAFALLTAAGDDLAADRARLESFLAGLGS